jgi:hypothetical protein
MTLWRQINQASIPPDAHPDAEWIGYVDLFTTEDGREYMSVYGNGHHLAVAKVKEPEARDQQKLRDLANWLWDTADQRMDQEYWAPLITHKIRDADLEHLTLGDLARALEEKP